MAIHLEKINPEDNCFRFYNLSIEGDLFEPHALVAHWGRIGTRGRQAIRASGSRSEVEDAARKILRLRERHGYSPDLGGQALGPMLSD